MLKYTVHISAFRGKFNYKQTNSTKQNPIYACFFRVVYSLQVFRPKLTSILHLSDTCYMPRPSHPL